MHFKLLSGLGLRLGLELGLGLGLVVMYEFLFRWILPETLSFLVDVDQVVLSCLSRIPSSYLRRVLHRRRIRVSKLLTLYTLSTTIGVFFICY